MNALHECTDIHNTVESTVNNILQKNLDAHIIAIRNAGTADLEKLNLRMEHHEQRLNSFTDELANVSDRLAEIETNTPSTLRLFAEFKDIEKR